MPLDLIKYFEKRFASGETMSSRNRGFVTISRQTGCNGNHIAELLVRRLSDGTKWKYINKEILDESARKLRLSNYRLKKIFDAERLTHADEILSALSNRYYKSDRKMKRTIADVVRHFAMEGNIIIVGRAAVGFTSNLPNGLHVRLIAPEEWRVRSLSSREGFENIDIKKFVLENDKRKAALLQTFCNMKIEDIPFDLTINCSRFSEDSIVDIIIEAMRQKDIARQLSQEHAHSY